MSPALICVALLANPAAADPLIVIDPGHGGHDPGAVANGINEEDVNLDAGLAFRDWMELDSSDGGGGGSWDVEMTRETDVYISLSSRCDYANSLGADYFMSIHANAGGGDGTETYAYASGTTADDLAHHVQDEVLDHLGTRDRGVKYESFYVLVNTSMPADLNEMVFLDTWDDNAELMTAGNLDEVGLAHLHAIQLMTGSSSYTPSDDTDPGEPSGRVWFDDVPSSLETGDSFSVTVGYETDLHAFGERGQLGVRMVDAQSWDTLDTVSWDNGGTGLQGPEGDHDFSLVAPDQAGSVVFITWMAPLGGGWDDRYDDANTSASPTTVGGDEPVDTGLPPEEGEVELLAVPGFIVAGQPFELRVRYGDGIWDQQGRLGVELVELARGTVVESSIVTLDQLDQGVETFSFTYDGPAEQVFFHACAVEVGETFGAGSCRAEDSSESIPTRVMQGRERFIDGGCGCGGTGRPSTGWALALLAMLGLARRRRS